MYTFTEISLAQAKIARVTPPLKTLTFNAEMVRSTDLFSQIHISNIFLQRFLRFVNAASFKISPSRALLLPFCYGWNMGTFHSDTHKMRCFSKAFVESIWNQHIRVAMFTLISASDISNHPIPSYSSISVQWRQRVRKRADLIIRHVLVCLSTRSKSNSLWQAQILRLAYRWYMPWCHCTELNE